MRTFSLHKTNVRLTGNIKHVLDTNQNLFIESINSNQFLSSSVYKGVEFAENLSYGSNVRNFVKNFTNKDIIYDVVNESAINISNDLSNQYHQLYDYGCYSDSSNLIDENFRFFAPIQIGENSEEWPDKFVVLKLSGTATNNETASDWFNDGTLVQSFDLSKIRKHIFAQIERSFIDMSYENEININGLNIHTGLSNHVSEYSVNELFQNETTITEVDNWITNIFKRQNLIYSNIVNLEFAFTDDNIDNNFVRYGGFYVKSNIVNKELLDNYENSGALRLIEKSTGVKKYSNSDVIETYNVQSFSVFANSFGLNKKQICEFSFKLNPRIGSKLIIRYSDIIEFSHTFTKANIGRKIEDTCEYIVNAINANYTGVNSTVSAYIVNNNMIRLESNVTAVTDENITLEVPVGFIVKKPLFGTNTTNRFIGAGKNSILLNSYVNPTLFPKIMYLNDSTKVISNIIMVYEYKGDWIYELDMPITRSSKPDNIWFMKTEVDKPLLCSILDHRALDMCTEYSQYGDVLDFDIVKYKQYLEDTVNATDFTGSVLKYFNVEELSNVPDTEDVDGVVKPGIDVYKNLLRKRIDAFFDSITVDKDYLLKDIDIYTLEATTVSNEYDRLAENDNTSLIRSNKLYEFVNKWKYARGKDVYNNDYRLNLSLPFRYDNFSPSIKSINRDIRYHSHSWFIIGEGRPPYWDINETTVKKHLSYTKYPITKELLNDTTTDAYDLLSYNTDVSTHTAWSNIYYDKHQDCCFAFFKGILYQFESKTLNGYRFAIILKSSIPVLDDVFKIDIIKNDEFKTLTLFINFYIPDPILTLAEKDQSWYYLDRSLLYFSNEIYSTTNNSINFGTDRISLSLYDNSKVKKYLGNNVTTNWFYNDSTAGTILHVGRGDASIFNMPLNNILKVGDDFVIKYNPYLEDDQSEVDFSMRITFENIIEVTSEYFWCKNIIVRSNLTHDPDGVDDTDIFDNIVDSIETQNVYDEFIENSNIFRENNIIYISKGIAAENCTYDKIVTSSANNARYKEISLSNIKNVLSYTPIRINDSDKYLQMSILNPIEFKALINLKESNSELVKLTNQYLYPMSRYAGESEPQTTIISSFYDTIEHKNIFPSVENDVTVHRLIVSKIANNLNKVSTAYTDFKPSVNISFYQYLKALVGNVQTFENLSWISNPIEYRSRLSLVFNSDEKIYIDTTLTEFISINALLKQRVAAWIQMKTLLTIDEQNKYLNYKYVGNDSQIVDVAIDDDIVQSFILNTFLKIYRIESIVKSDGQIVQFNLTDSLITILNEQNIFNDVTNIRITFTR